MKSKIHFLVSLFVAGSLLTTGAKAQDDQGTATQELADKLANPVANLISVPFQNNVDYGMGAFHGSKYTINFQPVVPLSLGPKLNLITRYIIPIVDQHDITGEGESQFGLSDATLTAYFAPANSKNGITWGAGPAILVPIGTHDALSTRKWAIGPSVLALKQTKGWTFGLLANQLWSFAGDDERDDINQMYLQPFLSKSWKSGASIGINSEMTFDWVHDTTTAWLNPTVSGVTKLGKQTIQLVVGPRIPLSNQADFGFRGVLIFVFPK